LKYLLDYRLFESASDIIAAAAGNGTDEEALVKAVEDIKTLADLSKIDAELKSNPDSEYKSVKELVAGELGIFDRSYQEEIAKKFVELGLPNYLNDGIIPARPDRDQPDQSTQPDSASQTATPESQSLSQGKITVNSDKSAPLVVVFGGTDVGGRVSGDYMYDYFKPDTLPDTTTFIANSSRIDGARAWSEISDLGLTPTKKILYLFSGGYLPGMSLLNKVDPTEWAAIYLVDIWIGRNQHTENFYTNLATDFPDKVKYYYTGGEKSAGGSNNLAAKRQIIATVNRSKGSDSHMGANDIAVTDLVNDIRA